MPYLIQGDEFEIGPEMLPRLAAVMAESKELVLADATYRLRNSHGMLWFEDRAEAERVAARFEELGFANFVVDELLPVPRARVIGPGGEAPEAKVGLVALARIETETERKVSTANPNRLQVSYLGMGVAVPAAPAEDETVTERKTQYFLDALTREEHWRVRSSVMNRIVDTYLALDVSEARLSEGVRNLSREDRVIPLFRGLKQYEKELVWLFQLRYA